MKGGVERQPLVSVIIPTYNRAHLLPRAIDSVLTQTFGNFELIIVDDGSRDHTQSALDSYQDRRIRRLMHECNQGGSAARNTGIKAARGQYIAFLDSDDEWLPEKLWLQVNKIADSEENVGVIYSGYSLLDKWGKILESKVPTFKGQIKDIILRWSLITCSSMIIKKECFDRSGIFDENLQGCQDWDITIRLAKFYSFDFVPKVLVKRYLHGDSISTNLASKTKALERMLQKYKFEFPVENRAHICWRLGVFHALIGDHKKTRAYLWKSIKSRPLCKTGYIHYFLSLLSHSLHKKIIKNRCLGYVDEICYYY